MEGEAERSSLIDSDLNVYSFDYLEERLAQEFAGAKRYKRPLSVVAGRLDSLDEYEDAHGHQTAALMFKEFTGIAKESLRESDAAAIYDGTVLVMMLTDTPFEGAKVVAHRLHEQIQQLNEPGHEPHLTLSVGFETFGDAISGPQVLFENVMERLAEATRDGGDCVRPEVTARGGK